MKKILCIAALLLLPSLGNATDVTWADKTTGGTFSAADANEVKSAVNSKADSTELQALDAKSVDQWVDNISVYENEVVLYDGKFYKCILTHLASSVTTPGVGGSWESAWEEVPVTGITIESDPVFSAWDKDYGDLINKPTIPTAINDFGDVDTTGKATGKVLKFNASGTLVVGDDEIGAAGTGDITGVTAGSGLTGGGDAGAVTLTLDPTLEAAIDAATVAIAGMVDLTFDPATMTVIGTAPNQGVGVKAGVFELADPAILKADEINTPEKFAAALFPLIDDGATIKITEQANDPVAADMTPGQLIAATTSGDLFYKSDTGLLTFAGAYVPDPDAPIISSATIDTLGTSLAVLFDQPVETGAGGVGTWAIDCDVTTGIFLGAPTGSGTATYTFPITGGVVKAVDGCTFDYLAIADGIQDIETSEVVASIASGAIDNGSTVVASSTWVQENFMVDYVEVDAGTRISRNESTISFTFVPTNEDNYVYKDAGVAHFGSADLSHRFVTNTTFSGNNASMSWRWGVSTIIDDYKGMGTALANAMAFNSNGGKYQLKVMEDGVTITDSFDTSMLNTPCYVTIDFDADGGTNGTGLLTATIRTGSHTGDIADTLTINRSAGKAYTYQYLYGFNSFNSGVYNQYVTGTVSGLEIHE